MSDQKPTIKLKAIKPGATTKIEIGTGYYSRVQELLFYHVNSQPPEVGVQALKDLEKGEPKDKFQYHLLTLLSLVYSTEAAFQEAGLTEDKDVPIPEKTS